MDRAALLAAVAEKIHQNIDAVAGNDFGNYLEKWRRRSAVLNRLVTVTVAGESYTGKAMDITENGALVLQTADGDRRVFEAGDVSLNLIDHR